MGVDLGGRRIIQAEDGIRDVLKCDWSSDVCSSDLMQEQEIDYIVQTLNEFQLDLSK